MATVSGKVCDQCEKFGTDLEGWLRLIPENGKDIGPTRESGFDLCSDKCLLKLAKARNGQSEGQRGKRPSEQFKREVVRYSNNASMSATAQHFGISYHSVERWRAKYPEELIGALNDLIVE